ncbi:unnamed protein product [Leptidea sinapis]|uniref:Uncharacterized protein n=1 Tax=Leptidea sinapis TaxID=189913 RepID=A0A5E4PVT4_9NEOP|nr:unnamed protein product [Leptidea sinapis]
MLSELLEFPQTECEDAPEDLHLKAPLCIQRLASHVVTEQGDATLDPVRLRLVGGQLNGHHVVGGVAGGGQCPRPHQGLGHFVVFGEEHVQLRDTDSKVAVSELVGNVEPERAELASLQHNSVEQAQREQQPLESSSATGKNGEGVDVSHRRKSLCTVSGIMCSTLSSRTGIQDGDR